MRDKFIVLDSAARDRNGHSYSYSAAVLQAASEEGLTPVLLASAALPSTGAPGSATAVPVFTRDCYGRLATPPPLSNRFFLGLGDGLDHLAQFLWPPGLRWRVSQAAKAFGRWYLRLRFALELRRALGRIEASPGDILLMHTVDTLQVGGWALALSLVSARRLPTTALLFRHDLVHGQVHEGGVRPADAVALTRELAVIKAKALGARVHFVSDSTRLAEHHEILTGFSYRTVPNVVPPFRSRIPERGERHGRFHFVYLGNVRPEKGCALLLEAIRLLEPKPDVRVAFTVQVTANILGDDEYLRATIQAAEKLTGRGVELIRHLLSAQEYDELLQSADAVVLPYDPAAYFARTSAIFSEAVAAGRLVVVPAGTWMQEQLAEIGGGGIAFSPYEADALARALADVAEAPLRYAATPGAAARWCADNSATALVRLLRGIDGMAADGGGAAA
jgi:glycosyltransferase involved in cell wall biosynthesis